MTEPLRTTLLLADDHPLMRKGLREMVEEEGNYRILEETGNGERALELIERLRPDIAMLDIDMPGMNGLQVAEAVRTKKLPCRLIILTMYDTAAMLDRAMDLGVLGYVLKESAAAEVIEALRCVRDGKHYVSPGLAGHLVRRAERPAPFREREHDALSKLTPAERKVLTLVAQDRSTREIAEHLFISSRTVDTHRNNICQKLGLHGPNALYRFALEIKHRL